MATPMSIPQSRIEGSPGGNYLGGEIVYAPAPGYVTIGEVKAEWVNVEESRLGASAGPLSQKWSRIVRESEGLRLQGTGFDVFARGEELSTAERIVTTVTSAASAVSSTVRLGFTGQGPVATGGEKRLSFHWGDERIAVVSAEGDAVHILNTRGEGPPEWERPALKSSRMYNIKTVAFRPFAGSTIAVGCERGVAIWRRREVSYLTRGPHTQVSAVDWTSDGSLLASASPNDGPVILWEVGEKEATPLLSISGGARLLRWSPLNTSLLFVSSARKPTFQIWDKASWAFNNWVDISSPISCCCWSQDGSTLLFAPSDEAVIHVIRFEASTGRDPSPAARSHYLHSEMTNVIAIPYDRSDEQVLVKGVAKQIAWDAAGERLAIIFDTGYAENDGNSLIAVYSTRLRPVFRMTNIGWIRGPAEAGRPMSIDFKPSFKGGSLLGIVWENRQVTFVQMLYRSSIRR